MTNELVQIKDLHVSFPGSGFPRRQVDVLKGVSLDILPGETHGLVGESGSGKTTIGRALLGLVPVKSGTIRFAGECIEHAARRRRRELSRDLQVIFQDPYTSLNPSLCVGATLSEPLLAQGFSRGDARARIAQLLDRVGLPANAVERLPREFSGGQRQRVAIARAIGIGPKLIVCDEPVSALDLTTQKTVLELLIELQEETAVSYLFISHDLAVVRHLSHRVSVISRGEIVESGDAQKVTLNPEHPYTTRLLLSTPVVNPEEQRLRREEYERRYPVAAGKIQANQ